MAMSCTICCLLNATGCTLYECPERISERQLARLEEDIKVWGMLAEQSPENKMYAEHLAALKQLRAVKLFGKAIENSFKKPL